MTSGGAVVPHRWYVRGVYQPARERRRPGIGRIEVVCVIVVFVAFAALIAWAVLHAGGGVLNQG